MSVSGPTPTVLEVGDAAHQLPELLVRAQQGEQILLARGGTPVARLVGLERSLRDAFGCMKGEFEYPEDFLEPDPEIERMFGMRE